jgi:hypothetical protein
MRLRFKTIVVLLMLALLPVRALAAVTIGFCAMHHHGAAAPTVEHGASQEHDGLPLGDGSQEQCNACVEHCATASTVASSELPLPLAVSAQRIAVGEQFVAGFVPDQLDRPPLAL